VVVGRLQQRAWTTEDGSARSVVEVVPTSWAEPTVGDRHAEPGDQIGLSRAYCLASNAVVRPARSR
jgi:single-stranded DNA-binding protein